jgi:hypothetical protein
LGNYIHYYKLNIKQSNEGKDLIIIAKGKNQYLSDPDLYISSKPLTQENYLLDYEIACNAFGMEICIIDEKFIKKN